MAAKLSFDERACIEAFQTAGVDAQQIARQLGQTVSAIYRELKRNCCDNGGYDASVPPIQAVCFAGCLFWPCAQQQQRGLAASWAQARSRNAAPP